MPRPTIGPVQHGREDGRVRRIGCGGGGGTGGRDAVETRVGHIKRIITITTTTGGGGKWSKPRRRRRCCCCCGTKGIRHQTTWTRGHL